MEGRSSSNSSTDTVPTIVVYVTVPNKEAGKKLAESIVKAKLAACINRVPVFFDLTIGSQPAGRVEMELFTDTTPKTAENFRAFCTGEKGINKMGKPLHYRKSIFPRVIPRFRCQGGAFTYGNNLNDESIYGSKFADKNFTKK